MKAAKPSLVLVLAAGLAGCSVIPQAGSEAEAVPAVIAATLPAQQAAAPNPEKFTYAGALTQGGWIRGQVPAGTISAKLGDEPIIFDATGHFFAGFDHDATSSMTLAAQLPGGMTAQTQLTIAPRQWGESHLNIPLRKGGPSEAFMQRRLPELAQIKAARSTDHDVDGWQQHFIWPVKGRVSDPFGVRRFYQGEEGSYHSGIDISTGESGTPIVAPADGVVILAAQTPFSLEGNLLMIDHGEGLNSAFLHCSKIAVSVGDVVHQGQYIANIGMSGRATGPHLHWSVKWRDARIDPYLLTGPQ